MVIVSKHEQVLQLVEQRREIYRQIEIQEDMAEAISMKIDQLTEEIENGN